MKNLIQWIFILLLSFVMLIYTTSFSAYQLFVFYVTAVPIILLIYYGFSGLGVIDNNDKLRYVISFYNVIPVSILVYDVKYISILSPIGVLVYFHYVLLIHLLLFTFKKWLNID